MVRCLLGYVGLWCLRHSRVNQMEARLGNPEEARKPVAAALYVFENTPQTPMLLVGMVRAYCQMQGLNAEMAAVETPEPEKPLAPSPRGVVH